MTTESYLYRLPKVVNVPCLSWQECSLMFRKFDSAVWEESGEPEAEVFHVRQLAAWKFPLAELNLVQMSEKHRLFYWKTWTQNIFIGQRMGYKLLVQRMGMGTYLATLMKYWTMSDFKLVSVGSSFASDITDLDSKRKMAQAKMWSWPWKPKY